MLQTMFVFLACLFLAMVNDCPSIHGHILLWYLQTSNYYIFTKHTSHPSSPEWVDGTESQKKIDIALSASRTLVMNFIFYLIAKIILFLISETNSYLAIIVKTQTFKKWGKCFQSVIVNF